MRKDPTAFRERFKKWKETGEYELPRFEDGTEGAVNLLTGGTIGSNIQKIITKVWPISNLRQTIYKNVSPNGGYSIKQNIKDFGSYDPYNTSIDDIDVDPNVSNEIWAKYLQIPKNKRHETGKHDMLFPSKYKPSNSKGDTKYWGIKMDENHQNRLQEETDDLKIGESINSEIFADYNLGIHTVGRGVDPKKGEYRSYYDKWDLNPFNGKYEGVNIPWLNKKSDVTLGIGKPFEIYDRLYLSDYYKVNPKSIAPKKGDYYGGWLPELFVKPKKSKLYAE